MSGRKATRPDGGSVHHGGCDGCVTPQKYCGACRYFEFNADNRPDYNSGTIIERVMNGENVTAPTIIMIEGVEYRKAGA